MEKYIIIRSTATPAIQTHMFYAHNVFIKILTKFGGSNEGKSMFKPTTKTGETDFNDVVAVQDAAQRARNYLMDLNLLVTNIR